MPAKSDFTEVFEELKAIFKPYVKKMDVSQDTDTGYMLNTRFIMKNQHPLTFGMVRKGKNYVSFHLMAVYAVPDLVKQISPALKKRMQGKSCFNFNEVDRELFAELKKLTAAGAAKFSDGKFIDQVKATQERGRSGNFAS